MDNYRGRQCRAWGSSTQGEIFFGRQGERAYTKGTLASGMSKNIRCRTCLYKSKKRFGSLAAIQLPVRLPIQNGLVTAIPTATGDRHSIHKRKREAVLKNGPAHQTGWCCVLDTVCPGVQMLGCRQEHCVGHPLCPAGPSRGHWLWQAPPWV